MRVSDKDLFYVFILQFRSVGRLSYLSLASWGIRLGYILDLNAFCALMHSSSWYLLFLCCKRSLIVIFPFILYYSDLYFISFLLSLSLSLPLHHHSYIFLFLGLSWLRINRFGVNVLMWYTYTLFCCCCRCCCLVFYCSDQTYVQIYVNCRMVTIHDVNKSMFKSGW